VMPAWRAPSECRSHQVQGPRDARIIGNGRLALRDEIHQPLQRLRALADRDCWVRAWLRFSRAPAIAGGSIFDLRFTDRPGDGFSYLRLSARETCPPNVPNWRMPRADLIKGILGGTRKPM